MPNAQAEPAAAKPNVATASTAGPAARAPLAPVAGTFIGVNQSEAGFIPPDSTMAAGPTQVVVATNGRIKAFGNDGTLVPGSSMSLGQFFSTLSGAADGPFDPKVAFDPYVNRFWVSAASVFDNTSNGRSTLLVAVSDTSDVTQGWSFFQMNANLNGNSPSGRWCDYPQLGFDSQAVYFTCNMFPFTSPFILPIAISKVRILMKSEFTGSGCCTWWDQWGFGEGFLGLIPSFTMQPAKMYGAVNSDGEFLIDSHTTCIFACSDLELFHVSNAQDCCNGSSGPHFDQTGHGVGNFPGPPGGRQSGSSTTIDTGDTRLLYAFWQNGHIFTGQNMGDSGNAAVSFTELDVSGGLGNINTIQDWQMSNSGVDYYYPSVDTNAAGDKAMVFSRSGSSEFVSARFVTIPRSSSCHNCTGPEVVLASGDSTYVQLDPNSKNRWGDYSGAAADPDGTGIWVHGEFAAGSGRWGTVVGLVFEPIDHDLGITGVPANMTVNATGPTGAVVNYTMPTAVDEAADNPAPTVSCNPAPGSIFPMGTTTVTCTASSADDTPSSASGTFTVTVVDTDLGLAGMPADITVNATSPAGAVVTYTPPSAVDESDIPPATVTCLPASGSTFPIGNTTVTCTAFSADDTPDTVSQSFTVTVNDTDLALAGMPSDMTVDVNTPLGAVVTYTAPTAIDEAEIPPATATCVPPSGSTFALGDTIVTCTATSADDTPGTVSGTFTVTVLPTPTGITNVVGQLLAAGCIDNAGIANALTAKLSAAQNAIAAGHITTAINILNAFINQVQAQDGKHIHSSCTINGVTFSPAASLIAEALSLIASL